MASFTFKLIAPVLAVLTFQAAGAAENSCLPDGLEIDPQYDYRISNGQFWVEYNITNRMPHYLGGVRMVGFLDLPSRPVPLAELWIEERIIPGGLAPGETMSIYGRASLDERALGLFEADDQWSIRIEDVRVADADLRPIEDERSLGSWKGELSPLSCDRG